MQVFKCTRQMVWQALNFKSDSKLAQKIRFTALRMYGGVPSWKPLAFETTHDTVNGIMRQDFGNGVTLVVDLQTGEAMLGIEKESDGEAAMASQPTSEGTPERETERIVTVTKAISIEELMKLQSEAMKLAMSM